MRCREIALIVLALPMAWRLVAPLSAQAQSPPPSPGIIGQRQRTPNVPTLVFDAENKRYEAAPGEQIIPFTFSLTNVWTNEIVIDSVSASCGCSTAALPANPWHLPPQGSGEVKVQVNLAGKMGLLSKTLTFHTSVGERSVYFEVNVPPPPSLSGTMTEAERMAARLKANADAQAIFKGDCAKCHADKGRDAYGQDLFAVDCGICHEASRRDSKVPDLHALKKPTDFDYWKTVITFGKPHTMMPAFAAAQGGPLTQAQVNSLATYLNHTISHNLSSPSTNGASASVTSASALP